MIIYLDACCFSRPFDNQDHMAQERVRAEIIAIMDALEICKIACFSIVGSPVAVMEINKIKLDWKRRSVISFYNSMVTEEAPLTDAVDVRAGVLIAQSIKKFDAYHVAFAEAVGADYLLTTDDRLIGASGRLDFNVNVINPLTFMGEYQKWRR